MHQDSKTVAILCPAHPTAHHSGHHAHVLCPTHDVCTDADGASWNCHCCNPAGRATQLGHTIKTIRGRAAAFVNCGILCGDVIELVFFPRHCSHAVRADAAVRPAVCRRSFPGRIRGRNRFRPRRRESLEKISESVAKPKIGLDKIVPGGMRSAPDPVVGRLAEDPDMRGKAVL